MAPTRRRIVRGFGVLALAAGLTLAAWDYRSLLPGGPDGGQAALAERDPVAVPPAQALVAALGRIEPRDGVIRISGPSRVAVVIGDLRVGEGQRVKAGDVLAVLDSHDSDAAVVERLEAELANAARDLSRKRKLFRDGVLSDAAMDAAQLARDVAKAQLRRAEAELARAVVRAPADGQVLQVHARVGEKVGREGILEFGRTDEMYAVAEVYETDVRRIRVGQRAEISSPALDAPIAGEVERIGMKIGKLDALSTDPAARTDARVVEVEIRLDESEPVRNLTNLQVEVAIAP